MIGIYDIDKIFLSKFGIEVDLKPMKMEISFVFFTHEKQRIYDIDNIISQKS